MNAILPVAFANDELRLLTAVVIGGAFGFALERGGFGNARKLAAQFYFNDMTVLKVMFTAIIVAMTGVYTLAGLGVVDLSLVWIPPTFLWAQIIGGFVLGLGFIVSGLCPGTSLVSAASGRIDAMVALAGIFIGTWVFGVLVDWFPGLSALYQAGSLGVSTLPSLLHLPAWAVVSLVVAMAGGAFVGAEKVEALFAKTRPVVELTPATRAPYKFAVASVLLLVVVIGTAARRMPAAPTAIVPAPIAALDVAERIVARDPLLLLLDIRGDKAVNPIPGARVVTPDSAALDALGEGVPGRTTIVVYDADGTMRALPGYWPKGLEYRVMAGGRAGWENDVLTPSVPTSASVAERDRVNRQNQIATFFSGASVKAPMVVAPPPSAAGAAPKKKKSGGC